MGRREYVGNAAATTLNGAITAGSATIVITDGTNWPTGTNPFVVIIDRGLAAEEKVLITSRSGNTLTVSTRGFDSTTAASHANGATIEHGLSAADIDEVNDHTFDTTNDDHTQYLNNARHDVEARHTFGAALGTAAAPANLGLVASAGSGANPAREDHVHTVDDWAAWSPTLTNLTLGNGTVVARFARIGDMVHWRFRFTLGSTSAVGTGPTFSPPVTIASTGYATNISPLGPCSLADSGTNVRLGIALFGSTTAIRLDSVDGSTIFQAITSTVPFTWTTGDSIDASGTYEAA